MDRVLVEVALAIADGAEAATDVRALAGQEGLHGSVGSVASTFDNRTVLAGNDPATLVQTWRAWALARTWLGWLAVS